MKVSLTKIRHSTATGFVVIFSIILRLLYSAFIDRTGIGDINGLGDQTFYLETAKSIVETSTYSIDNSYTYFRAPLYSYFISIVYNSNPSTWVWNIVLAQTLLTYCSSVLFSYAISIRFGDIISILWLILWLWTPFSFIQDQLILQESLYTSLLITSLSLSLLYGTLRNRLFNLFILPVLIGFVLALTSLTREVYALYPTLLFPATAILMPFQMRFKIRSLAISTAVFVLIILPWICRNYLLLPGPPFISKGIMGMSLYYGTWVEGGGSKWSQEWLQGQGLPPDAFRLTSFSPKFVQKAASTRNDTDLKRIAIDSILRHPMQVFLTWLRRVPSMWLGTRSDLAELTLPRGSTYWILLKSVLYIANFIVVVGGIAFFMSPYRSFSPAILVLATLPVYNLLIYLPFLNIETRYSHPSLPILMLFSSLVFCSLSRQIYRKL